MSFKNLNSFNKNIFSQFGEDGIIEEIFNQDSEDSNNESNETEVINSTNEDGIMVFGGGNSVTLSNSQFDQLKSTVMDLRTSIVEGN